MYTNTRVDTVPARLGLWGVLVCLAALGGCGTGGGLGPDAYSFAFFGGGTAYDYSAPPVYDSPLLVDTAPVGVIDDGYYVDDSGGYYDASADYYTDEEYWDYSGGDYGYEDPFGP